jgi:hypothetical protein
MNFRQNCNPRPIADAVYQNATLVAHEILDQIADLFSEVPATGNEEHPVHWSHFGSIEKDNFCLPAAVTFLGGTGRPVSKRSGMHRRAAAIQVCRW